VATRRSRRRDSRGAVAVEFALLLPILWLIFSGLVDFALAYNAQIQVSQAAQAGARASSLNGDALGKAQGASPTLGLTAGDVSASGCSGGADSTASVTVSYTFHPLLPVPGLTSDKTISQTAVTPCTPS